MYTFYIGRDLIWQYSIIIHDLLGTCYKKIAFFMLYINTVYTVTINTISK